MERTRLFFTLLLVGLFSQLNLFPQNLPDLVPWDVFELRYVLDDPDSTCSANPNRETIRFGLKTGNIGTGAFVRNPTLHTVLAEYKIEEFVGGAWQLVSSRLKNIQCTRDDGKMCPVTDPSTASFVCGNEGISPKWFDNYWPELSGQWVCMEDRRSGTFRLTVRSDPNGQVTESNENNNTMTIEFTVTDGNPPFISDIKPPQFSFSTSCFEDEFDAKDSQDGTNFFSNNSGSLLRTGERWAIARHGGPDAFPYCDIKLRTIPGESNVVEARFTGRAGDNGSRWTLAGWENAYVPKSAEQTFKINVSPTVGDFAGKKGRIAVALVGRTVMSPDQVCSATGQTYEEQRFGGSSKAGIELDTGTPFIYFDPPYSETNWPNAVSLSGVTLLQISAKYTGAGVTLTIKDQNGAQLFSGSTTYPPGWNFSGTTTGCFEYYGVAPGTTGTVYIRNFAVSLP